MEIEDVCGFMGVFAAIVGCIILYMSPIYLLIGNHIFTCCCLLICPMMLILGTLFLIIGILFRISNTLEREVKE